MDRIKRAKMRRRFFRNLAPAYDASARMVLFGYYYHMRRQVREKIDIKEGMRILDIASGTGYVAEILKPAVGDGGTGGISVGKEKTNRYYNLNISTHNT